MMDPTRKKLEELARWVAETAPHELDCEAVLDRLAPLVEQTAGGQPLGEELRVVEQHLKVCPPCHEEFMMLLELHEPRDTQ